MNLSELYIAYYPRLVRFAKEYVTSKEDAENIIQDVFLGLWERRESLSHIENINAYFFRLVRNKCLDYIKCKITAERFYKAAQISSEIELSLRLQSLDRFDDFLISERDIDSIVSEAVKDLPEKCREIFILSRMEGLRYKEISNRLDISVNTVENQMSIALKKLRVKFKCYMS